MNVYFDETNFLGLYIDFDSNFDDLDNLLSAMELVSDSPNLHLYFPDDFYSILYNGVLASEILYTRSGEGSVRDFVRRFEYMVDLAIIVPPSEEYGSTALSPLYTGASGGLLSLEDYSAESWKDNALIYQFSNQKSLRVATRSFFVTAGIAEAEFPAYCSIMFDSLHFHCKPENIKNMGLRFATSICDLIKHFSYLNDHVLHDFESSSTDRETTIKAGSKGVSMSPESNKTRNNASAMQKREITIMGEKIVCEWHTKLTPTNGRIHFYPWTKRHAKLSREYGDSIIVGILCRHLD